MSDLNSSNKQSIGILGCGWFGFPLAQSLVKLGHNVKGSTTSIEKLDKLVEAGILPFLLDIQADKIIGDSIFFNSDILVVNIPPKRSSTEVLIYPHKIEQICSAAYKAGVKHIIYVSSTGVYGNVNKTVSELDVPKPESQSGKVLLQGEDIVKNTTNATSTVLRFGGLIGQGRDPGRFFAGKQHIANGQSSVNLVDLDDCIGVLLQIIEKQAFGHTYNVCAPHHPSRADFYTHAAQKSGLAKPSFMDELTSWKIVESVNIPKLLAYTFKVSQLI